MYMLFGRHLHIRRRHAGFGPVVVLNLLPLARSPPLMSTGVATTTLPLSGRHDHCSLFSRLYRGVAQGRLAGVRQDRAEDGWQSPQRAPR